MTAALHFASVRAQFIASLPVAVTVEPAYMTNTDGTLKRVQYVILDGGPPDVLDDERLASPQSTDSDAEYLYDVKAVAVNFDGCLNLVQKVLDGVVGFRPVVEGRNCNAIELDDSDKIKPDYTVKPPLFYCDMTLLLKSSRA